MGERDNRQETLNGELHNIENVTVLKTKRFQVSFGIFVAGLISFGTIMLAASQLYMSWLQVLQTEQNSVILGI